MIERALFIKLSMKRRDRWILKLIHERSHCAISHSHIAGISIKRHSISLYSFPLCNFYNLIILHGICHWITHYLLSPKQLCSSFLSNLFFNCSLVKSLRFPWEIIERDRGNSTVVDRNEILFRGSCNGCTISLYLKYLTRFLKYLKLHREFRF